MSGGGKSNAPTIVFFHGNAGNIGLRLPNAIQMVGYHYLQANIWLVEYRGYGDSDDATPNEAGLKLDAEAVMKYVHNPNNNLRYIDSRRMFVFGRSLGGAVAFHMTQYSQSKNFAPLAGLIVENTFLSISEMVDHLMPLVAPLKSLVLRIGWDNGKVAPTIRVPTLFLAGAKDTLVPHSHMLKLYSIMKDSKVGNVVRMHIVKNGTHNETWMQGGTEYWRAIQNFMQEVFAEERSSGGNAVGMSASLSGNGPIQRKGTGLTAATTSSSSIAKDSKSCPSDGVGGSSTLEVGMGGEDAAGMISSVGNFLGMAKEATRSAASKGGASGSVAYKKRD
eukprot:scaffold110_cov285-Alexandrium_tamarense.AAC.2